MARRATYFPIQHAAAYTPKLGRLAGVLAAALLWMGSAGPAMAQQIWFGPMDDLPRGNKLPAATDFPQLSTAPSQWAAAASHIDVLSLTPFYVTHAPEEKLRNFITFASDHHIRLNIALQAVPAENCGRGIEGMVATVAEPLAVVRRLKQLGARVDYFAFDEPLVFGHFYAGPNACRYPIAEVARRLAQTVKAVREIYPQAQFVDYEVPTNEALPQWTDTLNAWLKAYRAETGETLHAMVLDADWRKQWQEPVWATIRILEANHVRSGLFVDAVGGPQVTDASWMAEARRNIESIKAAKLSLDFVLITSWMGHPARNLPDSDPLSLTSLIDWYAQGGPKQ